MSNSAPESTPESLPVPSARIPEEIQLDDRTFDLLMYGNEQILRGADNGTLVAFAALAFQQIRGKGEPHQSLGCGILLFSVLMCAVVHFSIGSVYVGRVKKVIRGGNESWRHSLVRRVSHGVAWTAAAFQVLSLAVGVPLVMLEKAPPWLMDLVPQYFK